MGAETLFMVALHSRRSALQNSGNQDKLSQPTTILIYPEGRVCFGRIHTDTKVLPIPSSSCFMAPRLGKSRSAHRIWSENSIIAKPPSRLSSRCESRSARAGGHRHRKLGGVVEALGHRRDGSCEAALYVVRYGQRMIWSTYTKVLPIP